MNKLMQQERLLTEETTTQLKEELAEARAQAQAAAASNLTMPPTDMSDLIKTLKEEVSAAEETNTKQASFVKQLSDRKQRMEREAKEYCQHCIQYVRGIADIRKDKEDLERAKEDLERAKEKAYTSISEQNDVVKDLTKKDKQRMTEMHRQSQQALTLKLL